MTDEAFRNERGIDIANFSAEAKSHGVFVVQDNNFSIESISCFPRFGFSCQFRRRYYYLHLQCTSSFALPHDILEVMVSFLEPTLLSAGDELELQVYSRKMKKKVLSVEHGPVLKIELEDQPIQEFCFDIVSFRDQSCRVIMELRSYQSAEYLPASMVAFDPENVNRWLIVMFSPLGSKYHSRGITFLHFCCEFPQNYPFKPPSFRLLDEASGIFNLFEVSMLNPGWVPYMNLSLVLHAIQKEMIF
eukprot:TRINITY_DN20076_c0_g1_i1.p1 TRINITY_DN20076_c0_g1~~TRINITY_DN20076_c0_g1_i1.p1  ORF type:complete len:277 (-),score=53.20 TRINITY_DN20076_c0_g1_i1:115-852(-)